MSEPSFQAGRESSKRRKTLKPRKSDGRTSLSGPGVRAFPDRPSAASGTRVLPALGRPQSSEDHYWQRNETFSEGEDEKVVIVNAAYLEQHVPFVRDRLKRAGIRLGNLLNTTLGQ